MVQSERVYHPPEIQYGGLKPEVVKKTIENGLTTRVSSVLYQIATLFQWLNPYCI